MKTQTFLARPRYLRAIPSLVLLTTAMAWGMATDMVDGDGERTHKKAGVTISQNVTPTVTLLPANSKKGV